MNLILYFFTNEKKIGEMIDKYIQLRIKKVPPIAPNVRAYNSKTISSGGMLHIIPLSTFCPPKIDVALKITIEIIQW
jgi:hypothetical protein